MCSFLYECIITPDNKDGFDGGIFFVWLFFERRVEWRVLVGGLVCGVLMVMYIFGEFLFTK